jgi:TPR repeat protein
MTEENKRCRLALDSVAHEWLCPITHELPLDPWMAEDCASIEEWFRRKETAICSPVTNAPMGRALISATQARNTMKCLVEAGAITGEKADSWKMRSAQEEEVRLMRQRATAGDVDAMRALGLWYRFGRNGLKKDDAQAFPWLKQAADSGDVEAMANVGWMYCHGSGVPINVNRGAARLGQAAALGSDWACCELGNYHKDGICGYDKDAAEASFYFARIPSCTVKHLSAEELSDAAEWLSAVGAHPAAEHDD